MKSNRIITLLGFVCLLALVSGSASTAIAEEGGSFKNHDGTWIAPGDGGPSAYVTCASTGNSSSRSYTCTGSVFMPDGLIVPMFWDGFLTGPRTYRERGIGYMYGDPLPYDFILVHIVAGRVKDDNTLDNNSILKIYMDFDGDGLPSDGELIDPGSPQSGTIYRMVSIFPDIPFPDYPPEP